MSQSRSEIKVGVFVMVCLLLLAALLLQFSKGTTLFRPTYPILLKAANVGGLKPRASVLMSGVQVGTVDRTLLSPEGTSVTIYLKIYKQYVIHDDARFAIEQNGFLGDQYVAIYPQKNQGPPLYPPNNTAHVQEPFNIQEFTRSAAGFVQRIDDTAKKLDGAIDDVRHLVLDEKTLTNLSFTVGTFRQVSEDALQTVDNLNQLIRTNGVPVAIAVSNLVVFSDRLNVLVQNAQGVLSTNEPQITAAINNIQTSTAMLTNLLHQAETGKGLAGSLLANEGLANNVSLLASNLNYALSNLNALGLWRFLKKPKPPPQSR